MKSSDRIITICADLSRFMYDYAVLTGSGIPNDRDIVRYHVLSMVLFTILNLCFELGEEVISFYLPRSPSHTVTSSGYYIVNR